MITEEKHRNALEALNRVLGVARMMGYENRTGADIAKVLDTAEYLVVLFLKAEDCDSIFRKNLESLAETDDRFRHALRWFDGLVQP